MANPLAAFLAGLGQSAQTIGTQFNETALRRDLDEERRAANEQALIRAVFIRMGIDPETGEELPGFIDARKKFTESGRRPRSSGGGDDGGFSYLD